MKAIINPAITIDQRARKITRTGLLVNRIMHPLVSRRFGREMGMLVQTSDVTIKVTQSRLTAQSLSGQTAVTYPLYSGLLAKAGVSEIEIPKGLGPDQIGEIFRVVTTRALKDIRIPIKHTGISAGSGVVRPFTLFSDYRVARLIRIALGDSNRAGRAFIRLNSIGLLTTELLERLSQSRSDDVLRRTALHANATDEIKSRIILHIAESGVRYRFRQFVPIERPYRGGLNVTGYNETPLRCPMGPEYSEPQIADALLIFRSLNELNKPLVMEKIRIQFHLLASEIEKRIK